MSWNIWRKSTNTRFEDAKELAALLGASVGGSDLNTDFAGWAEQILHQLFVDKYGELGPAPELLQSKRMEFEAELKSLPGSDSGPSTRRPRNRATWLRQPSR